MWRGLVRIRSGRAQPTCNRSGRFKKKIGRIRPRPSGFFVLFLSLRKMLKSCSFLNELATDGGLCLLMVSF